MDAQTPLSIYIHIPFCQTRCTYCAFNVYTDLDALIPAYVEAVCAELEQVAPKLPQRRAHTLYFGGGTPSRLAADFYDKIIGCVQSCFQLADEAEISLEANPDDLSLAYLRGLRRLGVNRLSIGMQSASPGILRLFGRRHDLATVAQAMDCARAAGFDNVNLDLIFASPGETLSDWTITLEALLAFAPEHVSMYGLELKGGTDLRLRVDAGQLPRPDDDLFADMYELASERLAGAGYQQYEISNWSRAGRECRHSLQYWRNLPYLGIGAGSHGFARGLRYVNVATPGKYIQALRQGRPADDEMPLTPAAAQIKTVNREDDLYDTIMMSLRMTGEGIHRQRFVSRFGVDIVEAFPAALRKLQALDLVRVEPDRLRLSQRGRLLSNAVIRELV